MSEKKVFVVVGQSFWQRILSSLFTLGFLTFLICLSVYLGSMFWQVFMCLIFLVSMIGKISYLSGSAFYFKNKDEIREWATPQAHESVQNGTCDEVSDDSNRD